jgi:hypothetical protein
MHALLRKVKQWFDTNKERLTFIKYEGSRKLRVRMRLVVATRL